MAALSVRSGAAGNVLAPPASRGGAPPGKEGGVSKRQAAATVPGTAAMPHGRPKAKAATADRPATLTAVQIEALQTGTPSAGEGVRPAVTD